MTAGDASGPTVSTAGEFEDTIEVVVEAAIDAGVDVRGAHEVEIEDHPRDFEVYVSAVVDSEDSTD